MKTRSLHLVVLLTATLISTNSVAAAEPPSFGILGGAHLANLTIQPEPTDAGLDSIWRPHVGGLVELGLTPNFSLQSRGVYVPKGVALVDPSGEVDLRAEIIIDYVAVPVLLKFQADRGRIRPYAVVGPELGFEVRTRASVTASSSVPEEIVNIVEDELTHLVDNNSKKTDVALDIGGGVEIPSGRMSILIEGIYSLGLRNIAIPAEGEEGSAKTRTLMFSLGIRF
jgi:hypothetical protein